MKKWLIRLFLVLLVLLAALYWQRVSTIDQQLERVASGLADHGRLSWGSVIIDPRGRAIVGNVEFRPHREPGTIRAESMTLRSSDLIELLSLRPDPDRRRLPDQWFLDLEGLHLPIGPQLSDWSLESLGLLLPFRSRACPGFERPGLGDLIRLGYGRLIMDLRLEARSTRDLLQIDLVAEIQGLGNTQQHWELTGSPSIMEPGDLQALLADGSLRTVDYRIEDRGLLRRLDAACAAATEDSGDPGAAHFRAWLRAWSDLGLEPGNIVQAAFRHHLEQPSAAVSISARPESTLPLSSLQSPLDAELIKSLNLAFAIDEGPLVPVELREVPSTRVSPSPPPAEEPTTSVLRSEDNETTTITVGRPPEWERIQHGEVAEHTGSQVRIDLIDGTRLIGRIAGLEGDQLALMTQSRIGEFVRPVPMSDIISIEVRP